MAGVLLLVGGTQTLSVGTALLGTVLGLVVYMGTLALTREISVTHPRRWLGVWRTLLLKD
jgi:hypothetical protein